jgi:putative membrane protein
MKRFSQIFPAIALACAVTACAGGGTRDRNEGATGTTGTAGTSADIDRKWVVEQLEEGDAEVRLGRLAEERAADAGVRAFGAMMVEKHTMAGTELKRIATRHDIAQDPRHTPGSDQFEKLSKLKGREFDRAYLDMMVDEHEEALKAIEDKARDAGEHADVRDWAAKTLPEVREHLDRAKSLRERLDRRPGQ